jgi:two-component system, NtrC family, response regulator GlrR
MGSMNQEKVLLLDFVPLRGLGDRLRGIIASACDPRLEVQYDSMSERERDLVDVNDFRGNVQPNVILLTLPESAFKKVNNLFESLTRLWPLAPIIVAVESGRPAELLELLKSGAADFVTEPLKSIEVLPRLYRLLDQARQPESLVRTLKGKLGLRQFVGSSPAFLMQVKNIPLVAKSDARVLISGETGTGKELCARAIHYLGGRAHMPFTCVNCGAIPVQLIENELFGHAKGAYTGATTLQRGLIKETDGGTLFLDEVDCLPSLAQIKLLRFLQDKEYRPLGSTRVCKADVRVIAATNTDLEKAVRNGVFRRDFYYRLHVISLVLPPLRERQEDIPLLVSHFLEKYAAEFNKPLAKFSKDVMRRLSQHDWPGNVRELEHVVEQAVALSEGDVIYEVNSLSIPSVADERQESFNQAKTKVVAEFEKTYIQNLLIAHRGNITRAAQAARKHRRAFSQLIRKHEINVAHFRPAAG